MTFDHVVQQQDRRHQPLVVCRATGSGLRGRGEIWQYPLLVDARGEIDCDSGNQSLRDASSRRYSAGSVRYNCPRPWWRSLVAAAVLVYWWQWRGSPQAQMSRSTWWDFDLGHCRLQRKQVIMVVSLRFWSTWPARRVFGLRVRA